MLHSSAPWLRVCVVAAADTGGGVGGVTKRLVKASARSLMVDGVGREESLLDAARSKGEVDSESEGEDTVLVRWT